MIEKKERRMYCPKCGAENAADSTVCTGCGAVFIIKTQKTSGLAIASMVIGIFGLNFFVQLYGFGIPCIAGLVLGLVALRKIKKSGGLLAGRGFAITGVILSTLEVIIAACLFAGAAFVLPRFMDTHKTAYQMICSRNLKGLHKAILLYSNDYGGQYPQANKWCDLLVEHANASSEKFVCDSAAEGRCHYAINPNAKPNSPPDVVLLFETKGGWNQFGGSELLTFENHKGKGCNVLFNDRSVRFIKPEAVGELKWGVEQKK
ncbi:MAG: DUF4190 domain-containing protein [Planctomycetota bacterium]